MLFYSSQGVIPSAEWLVCITFNPEVWHSNPAWAQRTSFHFWYGDQGSQHRSVHDESLNRSLTHHQTRDRLRWQTFFAFPLPTNKHQLSVQSRVWSDFLYLCPHASSGSSGCCLSGLLLLFDVPLWMQIFSNNGWRGGRCEPHARPLNLLNTIFGLLFHGIASPEGGKQHRRRRPLVTLQMWEASLACHPPLS